MNDSLIKISRRITTTALTVHDIPNEIEGGTLSHLEPIDQPKRPVSLDADVSSYIHGVVKALSKVTNNSEDTIISRIRSVLDQSSDIQRSLYEVSTQFIKESQVTKIDKREPLINEYHYRCIEYLFPKSINIKTYLDFGCGNDNRTQYLVKLLDMKLTNKDYYTCDIVPRVENNFFLVDSVNPVIPDGYPKSFDIVSLYCVIHHIPNFDLNHLGFLANITNQYLVIREHDISSNDTYSRNYVMGYHMPFSTIENRSYQDTRDYLDSITFRSLAELDELLRKHFIRFRISYDRNVQRLYYAIYRKISNAT